MRYTLTESLLLVCVLAVLIPGGDAAADGFFSGFKDTLDGDFDMSAWLSRAYGFMPVVSIITEPAIGPGAGLGLMFLNRDRSEIGQMITEPPDIAGVFGMYTANGSWGVGGGYRGYWKNDSIRYLGGLGYLSLNLKYYPAWPQDLSDKGVDFNIKGAGTIQDLSFRIPKTRLFLGAAYTFFRSIVSLEIPLESIDKWELDTNIGGLGATAVYDNRDNTFTPDNGIRTGIRYTFYSPTFGSDKTFDILNTYALGYHLLGDRYMLALRLDGRFSFERTPFYMRPYIELRGVPAMRYQGEYTLVAETEFRWDFKYRWSLILFTGVGSAVPVNGGWDDRTDAYNFGGGLRYFLARLYGIRAGIDVARGPEEWALYITIGQAWGRY
ncbi:MAG: BamA/TamA family outer membrane protein [bacterium]|jgi:hypothetical protein